MAIYALLNAGTFDPAARKVLAAAYEQALVELQLVDRTDPVTKLVAEKIALVYRAGETDPDTICKRAMKELGLPSD